MKRKILISILFTLPIIGTSFYFLNTKANFKATKFSSIPQGRLYDDIDNQNGNPQK
jgi:hypothetical protein